MINGRKIIVTPSASHNSHVNGRVHAQPLEDFGSDLTMTPMLPSKYGCAHTTPFSVLSAVMVVLAMNASQSPSSGTTRSYSVVGVSVVRHTNW